MDLMGAYKAVGKRKMLAGVSEPARGQAALGICSRAFPDSCVVPPA
jgi:hypothetical protein